MSLPPQAEWHYDYQPAPGSLEESTQLWLRRKAVDWLGVGVPHVAAC